MPTAAKETTSRRSAESAAAVAHDILRKNQVKEARRLFENQLVHVSLRMPKTATQIAQVEFEMSMQELVANVLATGDLLAEILRGHKEQATTDVELPQSTLRLRRAIVSAEMIDRGRFANAEEMFDALAKEARG